MNADVSLMVENLVQYKNGITKNVNVNSKNEYNDCVFKENYTWNPSICACE